MSGLGAKTGWIIGLGLVALAGAVGAVVFFLAPGIQTPSSAVTSPPTTTAEPISTASPSPTPTADGVPVEPDDEPIGEKVVPDGADPFIVGAYVSADLTAVTVNSFVPRLTDSGGTCTASVVGGSGGETASGPASFEVADTVCPPLTIVLSSPFREGLEVIVTYESANHTGTSAPAKVIQ